MTRLILTDQDLSNQTIKGQPFSYIGRCTGTDIKFVGDWKHMSLYGNDFLRPDWSEAKTRWSCCRDNTLTDIVPSPDLELQDHGMMLALLETGRAKLMSKAEGKAADALLSVLRADVQGTYAKGWPNLVAVYVKAAGTNAVEWYSRLVGLEHCVKLFERTMSSADENFVCYEETPIADNFAEGLRTSAWGVCVKSKDGRSYLRHWSELPKPKNPHDRVEMAELMEAEIKEETGVDCTFYISSIVPWRVYQSLGKHDRAWSLRWIN